MEEIENSSANEEQRNKIMAYLQQLYANLKDLIDQTRDKIKQNEEDFDHITTCL